MEQDIVGNFFLTWFIHRHIQENMPSFENSSVLEQKIGGYFSIIWFIQEKMLESQYNNPGGFV